MTASQISIIIIVTEVLLFIQKILKCQKFLTNVKDFQKYACYKIEMSDKTSLHILCQYRSPNSSSENKKLLNQMILNTSLIGGKLLILGDFNFPTINQDNLSTPHLSNHCDSEFLVPTQGAFLFQYVQSPTHTRPNQKSTLIDLIYSQVEQTIKNMTTSAPLGKIHQLKQNDISRELLNLLSDLLRNRKQRVVPGSNRKH